MKLHQVLASLLLIFSVSSTFAEELPLSSIEIDLNALKRWQSRTYSVIESQAVVVSRRGAKVTETKEMVTGYVTYKTTVSASGVIMDQTWGTCCARSNVNRRMALHYASNDLINIQKMVVWHGRDREEFDLVNGSFDLDIDNEPYQGSWPRGVLANSAMLRFVSFLPREKGKEYVFDRYVVAPEPQIVDKGAGRIRCDGTNPFCYFGKQFDATLYVVDNVNFWVRNSDGAVVMVRRPDGSGLVLTNRPCGPSGLCK